MSPRLTEIYNALIDDPDLIPPEDITKEDYALMLAQQRIRQYENNERALELGISKHIRPYTSAVNRLSSFVDLSKAKKSKTDDSEFDFEKFKKALIPVHHWPYDYSPTRLVKNLKKFHDQWEPHAKVLKEAFDVDLEEMKRQLEAIGDDEFKELPTDEKERHVEEIQQHLGKTDLSYQEGSKSKFEEDQLKAIDDLWNNHQASKASPRQEMSPEEAQAKLRGEFSDEKKQAINDLQQKEALARNQFKPYIEQAGAIDGINKIVPVDDLEEGKELEYSGNFKANEDVSDEDNHWLKILKNKGKEGSDNNKLALIMADLVGGIVFKHHQAVGRMKRDLAKAEAMRQEQEKSDDVISPEELEKIGDEAAKKIEVPDGNNWNNYRAINYASAENIQINNILSNLISDHNNPNYGELFDKLKVLSDRVNKHEYAKGPLRVGKSNKNVALAARFKYIRNLLNQNSIVADNIEKVGYTPPKGGKPKLTAAQKEQQWRDRFDVDEFQNHLLNVISDPRDDWGEDESLSDRAEALDLHVDNMKEFVEKYAGDKTYLEKAFDGLNFKDIEKKVGELAASHQFGEFVENEDELDDNMDRIAEFQENHFGKVGNEDDIQSMVDKFTGEEVDVSDPESEPEGGKEDKGVVDEVSELQRIAARRKQMEQDASVQKPMFQAGITPKLDAQGKPILDDSNKAHIYLDETDSKNFNSKWFDERQEEGPSKAARHNTNILHAFHNPEDGAYYEVHKPTDKTSGGPFGKRAFIRKLTQNDKGVWQEEITPHSTLDALKKEYNKLIKNANEKDKNLKIPDFVPTTGLKNADGELLYAEGKWKKPTDTRSDQERLDKEPFPIGDNKYWVEDDFGRLVPSDKLIKEIRAHNSYAGRHKKIIDALDFEGVNKANEANKAVPIGTSEPVTSEETETPEETEGTDTSKDKSKTTKTKPVTTNPKLDSVAASLEEAEVGFNIDDHREATKGLGLDAFKEYMEGIGIKWNKETVRWEATDKYKDPTKEKPKVTSKKGKGAGGFRNIDLGADDKGYSKTDLVNALKAQMKKEGIDIPTNMEGHPILDDIVGMTGNKRDEAFKNLWKDIKKGKALPQHPNWEAQSDKPSINDLNENLNENGDNEDNNIKDDPFAEGREIGMRKPLPHGIDDLDFSVQHKAMQLGLIKIGENGRPEFSPFGEKLFNGWNKQYQRAKSWMQREGHEEHILGYMNSLITMRDTDKDSPTFGQIIPTPEEYKLKSLKFNQNDLMSVASFNHFIGAINHGHEYEEDGKKIKISGKPKLIDFENKLLKADGSQFSKDDYEAWLNGDGPAPELEKRADKFGKPIINKDFDIDGLLEGGDRIKLDNHPIIHALIAARLSGITLTEADKKKIKLKIDLGSNSSKNHQKNLIAWGMQNRGANKEQVNEGLNNHEEKVKEKIEENNELPPEEQVSEEEIIASAAEEVLEEAKDKDWYQSGPIPPEAEQIGLWASSTLIPIAHNPFFDDGKGSDDVGLAEGWAVPIRPVVDDINNMDNIDDAKEALIKSRKDYVKARHLAQFHTLMQDEEGWTFRYDIQDAAKKAGQIHKNNLVAFQDNLEKFGMDKREFRDMLGFDVAKVGAREADDRKDFNKLNVDYALLYPRLSKSELAAQAASEDERYSGNPAEMKNELELRDLTDSDAEGQDGEIRTMERSFAGQKIKFSNVISDKDQQRQIMVVELPDGTRVPFYSRTGTGGREGKSDVGDWVPFGGMDNGQYSGIGWFLKGYVIGENMGSNHPLSRYGDAGKGGELRMAIGKALDRLRDEGKLPVLLDHDEFGGMGYHEINEFLGNDLALEMNAGGGDNIYMDSNGEFQRWADEKENHTKIRQLQLVARDNEIRDAGEKAVNYSINDEELEEESKIRRAELRNEELAFDDDGKLVQVSGDDPDMGPEQQGALFDMGDKDLDSHVKAKAKTEADEKREQERVKKEGAEERERRLHLPEHELHLEELKDFVEGLGENSSHRETLQFKLDRLNLDFEKFRGLDEALEKAEQHLDSLSEDDDDDVINAAKEDVENLKYRIEKVAKIKDKAIKSVNDMHSKHVEKQRNADIEAGVKGEGTPKKDKKEFDRNKALKRLAELQNPDLVGDDEALSAAVEALDKKYDDEVGFGDRYLQEALVAAHKNVENIGLQAGQAKQKLDKERAGVAARAKLDDYEHPDDFQEKHNQKMPKALVEQNLRDVLHHYYENYEHYNPKSGSFNKEDLLKLEARIRAYKDNGADFDKVAKELSDLEDAGIELGSKEHAQFNDPNRREPLIIPRKKGDPKVFEEGHQKEGQPFHHELQPVAIRDRQIDVEKKRNIHNNEHEKNRFDRALEKVHGNRAVDKDGNEVHHVYDDNGNLVEVPEGDLDIDHSHSEEAPKLNVVHPDSGDPHQELQAAYDKLHKAKLEGHPDDVAHKNELAALDKEHSDEVKTLNARFDKYDKTNREEFGNKVKELKKRHEAERKALISDDKLEGGKRPNFDKYDMDYLSLENERDRYRVVNFDNESLNEHMRGIENDIKNNVGVAKMREFADALDEAYAEAADNYKNGLVNFDNERLNALGRQNAIHNAMKERILERGRQLVEQRDAINNKNIEADKKIDSFKGAIELADKDAKDRLADINNKHKALKQKQVDAEYQVEGARAIGDEERIKSAEDNLKKVSKEYLNFEYKNKISNHNRDAQVIKEHLESQLDDAVVDQAKIRNDIADFDDAEAGILNEIKSDRGKIEDRIKNEQSEFKADWDAKLKVLDIQRKTALEKIDEDNIAKMKETIEPLYKRLQEEVEKINNELSKPEMQTEEEHTPIELPVLDWDAIAHDKEGSAYNQISAAVGGLYWNLDHQIQRGLGKYYSGKYNQFNHKIKELNDQWEEDNALWKRQVENFKSDWDNKYQILDKEFVAKNNEFKKIRHHDLNVLLWGLNEKKQKLIDKYEEKSPERKKLIEEAEIEFRGIAKNILDMDGNPILSPDDIEHMIANPHLGRDTEGNKAAHDEDRESDHYGYEGGYDTETGHPIGKPINKKKFDEMSEHEKMKRTPREEGESEDDYKDRLGKPHQTRMVKDPTDPTGMKMKKQLWIPGRGKGWVDEETYNGAVGDEKGKDDKIVLYPEGYFNDGVKHEQDEHENHSPSGAMVGINGNLLHHNQKDVDSKGNPIGNGHGLPDDEFLARKLGKDLEKLANHLDIEADNNPGEEGAKLKQLARDVRNHIAGNNKEPLDIDPKHFNAAIPGIVDKLNNKHKKIKRKDGFAEAQRRAASPSEQVGIKQAGQAFQGAANWLKQRKGATGKAATAVEALAGMFGGDDQAKQKAAEQIRDIRHQAQKLWGGEFYGPTKGLDRDRGGFKPKGLANADLKEELARLLPRGMRDKLLSPKLLRNIDISQGQERKNSLGQFREWQRKIEEQRDRVRGKPKN